MSNEFDFLNEIRNTPTPPPIYRKKTSNKLIPAVIGVLSTLCVVLVLVIVSLLANRPMGTAVSQVAGAVASVNTAVPTKEEWYAKYREFSKKYGDGSNYAAVHEADLFKIIGKPFKTQHIGDKDYWYWRCSDGMIQAIPCTTGLIPKKQTKPGEDPYEKLIMLQFNDY